ncbi:MAG: hypothetical protein NT062_37765 [Proteobacteria bacterium]|nr:hypothetical protein [Pseudomonadota bacterium]
MRHAVVLPLVASLLASSGCYYALGTSPASNPTRGDDDCTTSRALPIVDAVFAVEGAFGLGLGALGLAVSLSKKDDGSLPAGEARAGASLFLITGAVMLAVNGLSARAGFRDTAICRARPPSRPTYRPVYPAYGPPPNAPTTVPLAPPGGL